MAEIRTYETTYEPARKHAWTGAGLGIVAGIIFAGGEILAASLMALSPLMPIQMFASIVLGRGALTGLYSASTVLIAGIIVHLVLSAAFGAIYGMFVRFRSAATQTSFLREAALGTLFGLVVWAFNFYVVAPALFPWFLELPPLTQAMLHALCYGLPLGAMFAAATRRLIAPSMYTESRAYPRAGYPKERIYPPRTPRSPL